MDMMTIVLGTVGNGCMSWTDEMDEGMGRNDNDEMTIMKRTPGGAGINIYSSTY